RTAGFDRETDAFLGHGLADGQQTNVRRRAAHPFGRRRDLPPYGGEVAGKVLGAHGGGVGPAVGARLVGHGADATDEADWPARGARPSGDTGVPPGCAGYGCT